MTDGSGGGGDEAAAGTASGGSGSTKAATTPAVSSAAAMSPFGRYDSVAAGSAGSTFISLGGKTAHGIDIPPSAPTLYDDDDESDWDEEEDEDGSGTEAADRDTDVDRKASVAAAAAAFKAMTSPQSVAILPPALVVSSALSLTPSTMPLAPSTSPPLTVRMADDDDDNDEVVTGDSVDALVGNDAVSLDESFGAAPAAAHGVRAASDRDVQMVVVRSASSLTLSPPPSSTLGANIIAAARAAHAATVSSSAPSADVASSDRASGDATSSTSSDSAGDGGLSSAVAATTTTIAGRTFLAGEHVTIWNRLERRKIAGNAAPLGKNVTKYLNNHPNCEVYVDQDEAERPGASARRAAASARKRARLAAAALAEAESSELARRAAANSIPLQRLLAAAGDNEDGADDADSPHVHLDHNGMAMAGLPAQGGSLVPSMHGDDAAAPETPRLTMPDGEHVTIWNRVEGRKIAGSAAPRKANLAAYLARNPHCEAYDARKHPPTSSSAAAAAAAVAAVRRRVHGVSAEELAQQLSLDPWLVGLDSVSTPPDTAGVAGLADLDGAAATADDGGNLEVLLGLSVGGGSQAASASPFALDGVDDCGVAALPSTGLDFEAGTSPSGCLMALLS